MAEYAVNADGCVVSASGMTGDLICRNAGETCDCLMSRQDMRDGEADAIRRMMNPKEEAA